MKNYFSKLESVYIQGRNSRIARVSVYDINFYMKAAVKSGKQLREICGILLKDRGCIRLIQVPNQSKKLCSFQMSVISQTIARRRHIYPQSSMVGTFHSHPYGMIYPGLSDVEGGIHGKLMIIFALNVQKYGMWQVYKGERQKVKRVILCKSR